MLLLVLSCIGALLAAPAMAQPAGPVNIAALRGMPAPGADSHAEIFIGGYQDINDGGGGGFAWSPGNNADDDGGMVINPAGHDGPGRWIRLVAEPGVISPYYYGAKCDGKSDDAGAINQAINYVRKQRAFSDLAPITGLVRLPARPCLLKTTVNATGLGSAAVVIEGTGGNFLCETNGKPCFDAMGSGRLTLRDITIYGAQNAMPSYGLQLGRIASTATAAGMYLDHVTISGFFSFTAFYNLNAETQLDTKLNASNQAPGGYGAVWDGYNHWHASSDFINITAPVEKDQSFNDNTCLSCRITSNGPGGIPMWAGGTDELTFVNSYISNFNGGVGAVLYKFDTNLNFDAHFEAGKLTSVFLLTGQPHMRIYGFEYREHDFFGQTSMFALDQGVSAAELEDVNINIGRIHGPGRWFDDATKYTMSGQVAGAYAQGWETPGGGFSGLACFGIKCTMH